MNPLLLGPLLDAAGKVFDRLFPDQTQAEQAKLQLLKEASSQEFQLAMEQIKTNQEEAKHASIFVAGWRPAIGWVCATGLAWNFIGYDLAVWAASMWKPEFQPPRLLGDNLMELTFAMLGMAGLRTIDKIKGVTK